MNVAKEMSRLHALTVPQLRERYAEVFGEPTNAHNKDWLRKRIIWRTQALAEGDLSERARQRAAELANDADLRLSPPKDKAATTARSTIPFIKSSQLPTPGTTITKPYKGRMLEVTVLADGFEFEGERFSSLSAVAKAITGQHWNGRRFFGLPQKAKRNAS